MMENDPKKEKLFQIWKEVLYHDIIKEKYYSGKLEKKWKDLYTINAILLNRLYKIVDQYRVLHISVNDDYLKRYDRQNLKPIVVIKVEEKLR